MAIAPAEALVAPRPEPRGIDVLSTLENFAIVTWTVEPARLAALLPNWLTPELARLDDGREVAFISAVPFMDADFRLARLPGFHFRFPQTNYRAYIRRQGEACAWFFGTALGTPFVNVPRHVWKLPWHRARTKLDAEWEGERCRRYTLRSTGEIGETAFDLEDAGAELGRLDGFADAAQTAQILTHPLVGYMNGRDGRVRSYSIWHSRLPLRLGRALHARCQLFEELGLVSPGQAPHSVLLLRKTEFLIRLPPHVVTG